MKLAIVTRADDGIKEMSDITHPLIEEYAKKCGADFIKLDGEPPITTDDDHPHYRIMEVYDLYEKYERILVLDTDILIAPNCPNIFDIVPYDKIGVVYEDVGNRKGQRRQAIQNIQKKFGHIGWDNGYINNGVFLTSKIHKNIFRSINGCYYIEWGSDDVHIGYLINKNGHKVHELDYKWNHMTMFSEAWNHFADRHKSHIIHYAGIGQFNLLKSRLENIKSDKEVWYGKAK